MTGLWIILCHLVGDYILQTNSMAQRKTSSWWWALVHAAAYTVPYAVLAFILRGQVDWAWLAVVLVISGTHAVIDRYRLAKHLIWAVNNGLPHDGRDEYTWAEGRDNQGYTAEHPVWLRTWLMFIVDNTVHLVINAIAIGVLL